MSSITASKLRHRITVSCPNFSTDRYGAPVLEGEGLVSLPAEIVEERQERKTDDKGETHSTTIVFRVRNRSGLALSAPVTFDDRTFEIVALAPTEDRKGLEITCEARA